MPPRPGHQLGEKSLREAFRGIGEHTVLLPDLGEAPLFSLSIMGSLPNILLITKRGPVIRKWKCLSALTDGLRGTAPQVAVAVSRMATAWHT